MWLIALFSKLSIFSRLYIQICSAALYTSAYHGFDISRIFFKNFNIKTRNNRTKFVLSIKVYTWAICDSLATIYDCVTLTASMVTWEYVVTLKDHRTEKTNYSRRLLSTAFSIELIRKLPLGVPVKAHERFRNWWVRCVVTEKTSSWLLKCLHWSDPIFPACKSRYHCQPSKVRFARKLPKIWRKFKFLNSFSESQNKLCFSGPYL